MTFLIFTATDTGKPYELIHSGKTINIYTNIKYYFYYLLSYQLNFQYELHLELVIKINKTFFFSKSNWYIRQKYSNSEKAFLFDVVSKIYIATDSSPVDMQSYELCCDMIDVVIDVSCIYGYALTKSDKCLYVILIYFSIEWICLMPIQKTQM